MINVADNFSYLGQKPLDGRIKYDTLTAMKAVADSTMYDGCLAYCVAVDKTYQWKSTNTVDTDTGKWREFTSGGETGGGHTIEDPEGTVLTQRDTLQFGGDLKVSDDDENEKTVVAPHELTAAELAEIVTPLPSVPVNMPILFDETGTERVVGWYRLANGTKKPVYEKSLKSSWSGNIEKTAVYGVLDTLTNVLSDVDFVCGGSVWGDTNSGTDLAIDLSVALLVRVTNNKQNVIIQQVFSAGSMNGVGNIHVNVRYTKTTDTPT